MDVGKDPALAAVAEGRSELVGLALWLLAERAKVGWGGVGVGVGGVCGECSLAAAQLRCGSARVRLAAPGAVAAGRA